MVRKKIKKLISQSIREKVNFKVEKPEEVSFGDYSTNVALVLRKKPEELVEQLKKAKFLRKIEVKNGFINFFLSADYLQKEVKQILRKKEKYPCLKIGRGRKVNLEFISANPTGPLTLGNGRGGFAGDLLANLLTLAGFRVTREYYLNDTGEQIRKLGHSLLGDEEKVYQGDYIEDLKGRIKETEVERVGEEGAQIILSEMIKPSIEKMGIKFDLWFSEKSLYQQKETDRVLKLLREKKLVYEKEGALWFRSTQFADDKDRVLVRANGQPTYFLSDIAYLKNKLKRGFKVLYFFWGADHFGYINRLRAASQALGLESNNLKIIIMQLVRLVQGGQEVKMSKRKGIYYTLDELIDEVGLDVTRFFFLSRSADSHLNFDLDLAKEESSQNPVYYIQYAYARISSILEKVKVKASSNNLTLLTHPSELNLIKQLIRLPEMVEAIVNDLQVQKLPQYALDLATAFHQFYRDCRIVGEEKDLAEARLSLILATKIILKETLKLMGISQPKKM